MATFDISTRSLGVASAVRSSTTTLLGQNQLRKSKLLDRFTSTFICSNSLIFFTVDNIPTTHLQSLRQSVKKQYPGQANFIFGKNTLYKRAIKSLNEPSLNQLLPFIKGNVACLSCSSDNVNPIHLMNLLEQNSIQVTARPGMIANKDLLLPKIITSLSPERTSLFQAAGIHTRITNGKIEILREKLLTKSGDKIDETTSKILELLRMKPIDFDMKVKIIYENGELMDVDMVRGMELAFRNGLEKIMRIENWILGGKNVSRVEEESDRDLRRQPEPGEDCDCNCSDNVGMFGLFGDEQEGDEKPKIGRGEVEEEEELMMGIFGEEDD